MNLYDQTLALEQQAANGLSMGRSGLITDIQQPFGLPLTSFRATGTLAGLGTAAGTPAGAFGVTPGTFGTNTPKIVGEAASGASKTDVMRTLFVLPPEYVPGANVSVRAKCQEAVGHATVGTTVVIDAYKCDKAGGNTGGNLNITSPQAVTTTAGYKLFQLTPTGLVPGDILDIQVTGVTNDTGGAVGTILTIFDVQVLCDIKG